MYEWVNINVMILAKDSILHSDVSPGRNQRGDEHAEEAGRTPRCLNLIDTIKPAIENNAVNSKVRKVIEVRALIGPQVASRTS